MSEEKNYKVPEAPACRHCNLVMEKYDARDLDWGTPFLWVCCSDECTFFVKGWKHMQENFGQTVSYRYMVEPESGTEGVIPAFSPEYMAKQHLGVDPYAEPDTD